jgi:alanyl-tRNA synthetase
LEEIAAGVEAKELLDGADTLSSGNKVVSRIFEDRDAESLKHLGQALISHPQTIALLGSREKGAARLVFARSADTAGDMNALMKTACEILDGRGGGKPDMAQGGGHNVERLDEAVGMARKTFE